MDDDTNATNQGFTDEDEEELGLSPEENSPTGEDGVTEGDIAETELPVQDEDEVDENAEADMVNDNAEPLDDELVDDDDTV